MLLLYTFVFQVKERVTLSRKAQKTWAQSSFKLRRQFLRILLKYIIEHQELICEYVFISVLLSVFVIKVLFNLCTFFSRLMLSHLYLESLHVILERLWSMRPWEK